MEQRPLPEVEIVDMRAEFQQTGEERIFSRQLAQEVRERLERNQQAMILLNRRGYSPVVLCRACGETVQCRDCAIALTHHKRANTLICHYCGYRRPVPRLCPKCNSEHIFFLGTGSEKLEERLHQEFPRARIGRLDRDTVRRREDFERVLSQFDAGELDLLVGTQMIAKGHDVHGVTLVGVVGADFALGFPDFRAAERTFQLLTRQSNSADVLPRSLRHPVCRSAQLRRVLRQRAALPQMDELSPVHLRGQPGGTPRPSGASAAICGRAGAVV